MFKKKLIKGVISAFAVIIFCTAFIQTAKESGGTATVLAATKKVVVSTTDKLRVRTGAGQNFEHLSSDGVLVYLLKDKKANLRGEKIAADGVKWYKISFKFNGKSVKGFVSSSFAKVVTVKTTATTTTKVTAPALEETGEYSYTAEVNAKGLRLRTDAGTDKPQYKLGNSGVVLPEGQIVEITGEKNDKSGARWYKIKTTYDGNEIEGYLTAEFVKLDVSKKNTAAAKVIAAKGSTIRVKATSKGNELKTSSGKNVVLKKDTEISIFYEITLNNIKYYKVNFLLSKKNTTGYLQASEIQFIGTGETEEEETTPDDTGEETDDTDGGGSGVINPNPSGSFAVQRAYITSDRVELYNEADYSAEILKESETGISYKLSMNQEVVARKVYTVGNEKWYLITYEITDSTGKQIIGAGFVPEKFIKLSGEPVDVSTGSNGNRILTDEQFEASLAAQGFPEDYKPFLRELRKNHPYWHFEARHLNIDWEYAVEKESAVGLNLLKNSSNIAWKSTEPRAYDWANDAFIAYDAGGWVTASNKAVRYYMDPRNFLNEDYIYQFELLSFNPEYQSEEGVNAIVSGTPMSNAYYEMTTSLGEKKTLSYSETFMMAGIYSGVSPYHLASRVRQEVAGGGKFSSSVTGTVAGYEGYYNFYNIGANNNTIAGGAVASGLKFAMNGSSSKAVIGNKIFNDYIKIPWDSPYNSILGGAAYIGNNYILRGQNTPYLEKFNLTEKSTFSHQYMAAIFSPSSESLITKKAYAQMGDNSLVFSIPVFNNMPTEISPRPVDELHPNNWLKELSVKGYAMTPSFRPDTTEGYSVFVGKDVAQVEIAGKTANKSAVAAGLGQIRLNESGVTVLEVPVTAENGNVRTYKITVVREN